MRTFIDNLFSIPVDPVFADVNCVLVYGAGHTGHLVAQCLLSHGIEVRAFLDRQATPGKTVNGIPVLCVEHAKEFVNIPVIVAVFNPHRGARYSDIEHNLNLMGFASVCSLERFYISYPHYFPKIYWLANPEFYKTRADELTAVDQLWADERSRSLYRALIAYRITGESNQLPMPDPLESQYLPDDVPFEKTGLHFVDIDAYDGDTLEAFRANKIPLKKVIAFEPDMNNYKKLCARVKCHVDYAEDIVLIPAGVGEKCSITGFSDDASAASKMVGIEESEHHIPVVTLDYALHGFAPSYIKMDIEGAEESALLGMRDTVIKYRPMLAICVYHRPQDLFSIPLLLRSWGLLADFYLRMYGEHTLDTVLYVLPKHIESDPTVA